MVKIRPYQAIDADALWPLFFNTVRLVNVRNYSKEQVEAWAPEII